MNEIDKAIEELQDMAFRPSLEKWLSAETLSLIHISEPTRRS